MTLHIEYQSSDSEQQYTEDLVSRFLLNEMPGVSVNSVDLAELSAIKTLVCLQENVKKVYEPGLNIRVRLENATGEYLEGPEAIPAMKLYCDGFGKLCRLMSHRIGGGTFLFPRLETEGTAFNMYLDCAKGLAESFQLAYDTGDDSGLAKVGWGGGLSDDWKRYLDGRYVKIYPHFTQQQRNEMASKYLGSLLARVKLGLRGNDPEWQIGGRHIEIGFALPAPNAPLASCRIFYRTMSTRQTKLHMPFWRSKGFFRIVDGQMKMGLVASTDAGNATYIPGVLRLIDSGGTNLKVEADMLASVN
jgi:hypothetical protein